MDITNSLNGKTMLNKLLSEHDHMRKTLNLLEMQLLDLCRGKKPDLSIMRSIIVYIQEYPEQAHHPLEDMIYSILVKRETKIKLLQNLVADHTDMEVNARKLRDSLELYIHGSFPKDQLQQQLSRFISRQRQHIYIEEMEIFPLTQHLLTSADWEKIESSITSKDTPIFGERSNNDYELLSREIENCST